MKRLLVTAVLLLLANQVNACVEGYALNTGMFLKNSCPTKVNISWCLGRGCTPPTEWRSPSPADLQSRSALPSSD